MIQFARVLLTALVITASLPTPFRHVEVASVAWASLSANTNKPSELLQYASLNVRSDPITLGIASIHPEKKVAEYQDFVNYLTRKLTVRNNRRGTLHVVPTPLELAQLLKEHKIDFFMDSPYPTHIVNAHAGSRLVARRWKNGAGEYRGVIIARKDSGIVRVEDLRGATIAFEDPDSTSGYFLPRALLARKGLELRHRSTLTETEAGKQIGYIFAESSETNVVDWVLNKKVAAGAVSDKDLEQLDRKTRAELSVLVGSEPFPRNLVSVRKELMPRFGNQLKNLLFNMHRDSEGKNILRKMENTAKFDSIPVGQEDLQRRLFDLLPDNAAR